MKPGKYIRYDQSTHSSVMIVSVSLLTALVQLAQVRPIVSTVCLTTVWAPTSFNGSGGEGGQASQPASRPASPDEDWNFAMPRQTLKGPRKEGELWLASRCSCQREKGPSLVPKMRVRCHIIISQKAKTRSRLFLRGRGCGTGEGSCTRPSYTYT